MSARPAGPRVVKGSADSFFAHGSEPSTGFRRDSNVIDKRPAYLLGKGRHGRGGFLVVEERIGPSAQRLEAAIKTPDAAGMGALLEALGLGEVAAIEGGRLTFATDDLAGVRLAVASMGRNN